VAAMAQATNVSEMTLRDIVPLIEVPTSLRLMEFAYRTEDADATITFVNQSDWKIEVTGGRGEPVIDPKATVTVRCRGLGEIIHIVITAADGRSLSLGLPKRCGSEIVLLEAKPLSQVDSPARKEASR
jgi:hypothetical protein